MVIYEEVDNNTIRAYSDKKVMIHGGFPEGDYAEAYDPKESNRKYVETDILIPEDESTDDNSKSS